MRIAALVLAALAAPSCVSATDCGNDVPEELRADVYHYVIENDLTLQGQMPRDHMTLAFGAGQPFASLSPERQKQVALRAAGYATCIRERVDRTK